MVGLFSAILLGICLYIFIELVRPNRSILTGACDIRVFGKCLIRRLVLLEGVIFLGQSTSYS
ncbi:hypothetical protein BDV25DRAFT_64827 [Aspergillus avenaceus]|uniref:Uncharacterized protein n=1 Tax=Aspergillus avenaceus TaxID=36643 RepID=A0A5N6U9F9_ASPAV|nr:hypothetical protein BDV25DRAFT_64827 [Aspergillus avenaceus]